MYVTRMWQDDGSILRREGGKVIRNPNVEKPFLEDLV